MSSISSRCTVSALVLSLCLPVYAQDQVAQPTVTQPISYSDSANIIKHTYETQLYTLPPFKEGHYGLRMYRQTQDPKYKSAIWSDVARVADNLNKISAQTYTDEQIHAYSINRLSGYLDETDERSLRRFNATVKMPEYVFLGVSLLGSMARANEYGLKHREDGKLRAILQRHDFTPYVTNQKLIKAWAAQLANQVFWLQQLGEQDVVAPFIDAFRATYPDNLDASLTKQQYSNKVYGLTHIIFADSGYYQHPINEQEYQWLYDYLRENIDTIISRTKEDVIAEVGIAFLLAGLDDDPVVEKTRKHIQASIDKEHGLIPSETGDFGLEYGEHRNVLAIMLLDWQGAHAVPNVSNNPKIVTNVPYGLIKK